MATGTPPYSVYKVIFEDGMSHSPEVTTSFHWPSGGVTQTKRKISPLVFQQNEMCIFRYIDTHSLDTGRMGKGPYLWYVFSLHTPVEVISKHISILKTKIFVLLLLMYSLKNWRAKGSSVLLMKRHMAFEFAVLVSAS